MQEGYSNEPEKDVTSESEGARPSSGGNRAPPGKGAPGANVSAGRKGITTEKLIKDTLSTITRKFPVL